MSAQSSCRPDLLHHFDVVVQAMADGLQRRAARLAEAVAAYQAGCDAPYVIDCGEAVDTIGRWRGDLRVLGSWTKAVGRAFVVADVGDLYVAGQVAPAVHHLDDGAIAQTLGRFDDRYLGGPGASGSPGALIVGVQASVGADPAGKAPSLLERLGFNDDPSTVVGAGATGLSIALEQSAEHAAAGRAIGRASNALTAVVAGHHQWELDEGLGIPDRVARAATTATGAVLGAVGGQAVGEAAALECGPCAVVSGAAGNVVGGTLGGAAVQHLPWMHPGPHDPRNPDADRNIAEDAVANEADDLGPEAAAAIDVPAGRFAAAALADQPDAAAELPAVLPPTANEAAARPPSATPTTRPRPDRPIRPGLPTAPPAVAVAGVARPTG